MPTFSKILIANRGEIASRIIRTCHEMGVVTVAVFSDADRDAPFVRQADEAIYIGPSPSSESYLCQDAIISAAQRCHADAIHPGYGFLAENAIFARACADAGICFIGPAPKVIALLGSKQASKELVNKAGVPVVPSFALEHPNEIVYPVLLKASMGGGGKGMQIVREPSELASALASAKRVATSAFGDSTILIESYIESPRHIEIQILGDQHGTLVHLFERECSIQRRHQKIIEECPAPGLSPELRTSLAAAAITIARAVDYHNAGTVEFIVAPNGEFYFLEVNTRLQVEHAVTEEVTGIDLVREQIRIAEGKALSFGQDDIHQNGAALQCRLYAEDCDADFLPCSGTLLHVSMPTMPGLRVESGIESGSVVSIHYDPMLAKLITHAPTRSEALRLMKRSLATMAALGVTTNRDFLLSVLSHGSFETGQLDTGFLQQHSETLAILEEKEEFLGLALMAATYAKHDQQTCERSILPSMQASYRNNRWRDAQCTLRWNETTRTVHYHSAKDGSIEMRVDDGPAKALRCATSTGRTLVLEIDGHMQRFRVYWDRDRAFVQFQTYVYELHLAPRFPVLNDTKVEGRCIAPMPGRVVQVLVQDGDVVGAGDTLLVLEAMKMEHRIVANESGTVRSLTSQVGDQVDGGQELAMIDTSGV